MIVLSTKEEPKIKAEAFALGASDYLVKLPDKVELVARIRHHSQRLHRQRCSATRPTRRCCAASRRWPPSSPRRREYVRSLLPAPLDGPIATAWEFVSSTSLGGDGFGYFAARRRPLRHVPARRLRPRRRRRAALGVGDERAHRADAARTSTSAIPRRCSPALNDAFPMEKHNNMYFTIWYGVLHRPSRTLRYASAGHPPAVLIAPGAHARTPAHRRDADRLAAGRRRSRSPSTDRAAGRAALPLQRRRLRDHPPGRRADAPRRLRRAARRASRTARPRRASPPSSTPCAPCRAAPHFDDDVSLLEVVIA